MTFTRFLSETGMHEKAARSLFGDAVEYIGPTLFPHPLYCIGFYNRSGSNLLASYLRETPFFSGFHEHLNANQIETFARKFSTESFPDLIRKMIEHFGKGRRVHGFKASIDQLVMLERFGIPRMFDGGMKIIHITRGDVIGQAVSYQIALQTLKWTSKMEGAIPDTDIKFDPRQLTSIIDGIHSASDAISMFSKVFDHPYMRVTYEDLVQNPQAVLIRIAQFSGRPGRNWTLQTPQIERQANEVNEKFRHLYLEYLRSLTLKQTENT